MEANTKATTVTILLNHSLLSMGIASRLREQTDATNIQIIDVDSEPDVIQKMLLAQPPEIIILDAGDSEIGQKISIMKLFEWAPNAKVICLELSSERVRVFCSKEVTVSCANELVNIVQKFPQTV